LLLRRECCSFSNGEFLKAGLQDLEQWCSRTTEEVNIFLSFFGNFNKTEIIISKRVLIKLKYCP